MGIGVSVGPHKTFMEPKVQVLPVRRNRYVIHVHFTVYLRTGPGSKDLEFFGGDRLIMWAPNQWAWVRKLLDGMCEHEPHAMPTEREAMMHAASRALPKHLTRLLLRETMRQQGPLRQKLRRSLRREHAILWKKPRGDPTDWEALHKILVSCGQTRYRLAVIQDLMRDLGRYLPAPLRPPPQPPPRSCVDLKPPAPRRFGGTRGSASTTPPDQSGRADRRDLIRPTPPPPRE